MSENFITIGNLRFSEASVPFKKEMWDAVLSGTKDRTTRNQDYGKGKVFQHYDPKTFRTFIITDVRKHSLGYVARHLYHFEGFLTPEDFIAYWKVIHPRKGFDPEQRVFVHTFEEITPEEAWAYQEFSVDQTKLEV